MTETAIGPPLAAGRIRPAVRADKDAVARMLASEFAHGVPAASFARLFEHAWSSEDRLGLVVEADSRVVGYLGTVYSDRVDASGRAYTVCSLSSWYVQPAYRSMGLALLLRTINQRGVSVVSLSPNQNAAPVYLKCGMTEISPGFELYPAWHGVTASASLFRGPRLLTNHREIRALLPAHEQRLLDDHAAYSCAHYAFVQEHSVAYLVTKRRVRQSFPRLPITEILYFSDQPLVWQYFPRIVAGLCVAERCVGVAVDRALLGIDVPPGGQLRSRLRVGKGPDIALAARDTLYSEMVLLD